MRCDCGGEFEYIGTAMKGDRGALLYECNLCRYPYEAEFFRHTPDTCPNHQWGFYAYGFKDGYHRDTHRIYWIMECDNCGLKTTQDDIRLDSGALGRQRVEIEDPRVMRTLILNKDTARFHLGEHDAKEFWK